MSRFTAPMAAPNWGQLSAYTSDTRVALSICVSLSVVGVILKDRLTPTVRGSVEPS